jgi:hypothetical protein
MSDVFTLSVSDTTVLSKIKVVSEGCCHFGINCPVLDIFVYLPLIYFKILLERAVHGLSGTDG